MTSIALVFGMLAVGPIRPLAPAPLKAVAQVERSATEAAGLAALGAGGALAVLSAASFAFGLEAERELRAESRTRQAADGLLARRTAAAYVAWPSLVLAGAGIAAGVTLLSLDDHREGDVSAAKEQP